MLELTYTVVLTSSTVYGGPPTIDIRLQAWDKFRLALTYTTSDRVLIYTYTFQTVV